MHLNNADADSPRATIGLYIVYTCGAALIVWLGSFLLRVATQSGPIEAPGALSTETAKYDEPPNAASADSPAGLSRGAIALVVLVGALVLIVLVASLCTALWANVLTTAGLGIAFTSVTIGAATTPERQKTKWPYWTVGCLTLGGIILTGAPVVCSIFT